MMTTTTTTRRRRRKTTTKYDDERRRRRAITRWAGGGICTRCLRQSVNGDSKLDSPLIPGPRNFRWFGRGSCRSDISYQPTANTSIRPSLPPSFPLHHYNISFEESNSLRRNNNKTAATALRWETSSRRRPTIPPRPGTHFFAAGGAAHMQAPSESYVLNSPHPEGREE